MGLSTNQLRCFFCRVSKIGHVYTVLYLSFRAQLWLQICIAMVITHNSSINRCGVSPYNGFVIQHYSIIEPLLSRTARPSHYPKKLWFGMWVLWSMTFGEFRSPISINMHVFPIHQLLAIVSSPIYIYNRICLYNYIWIGYHHHWNGSYYTSNQPLKYIHFWIKHMFFSGSQPWVDCVYFHPCFGSNTASIQQFYTVLSCSTYLNQQKLINCVLNNYCYWLYPPIGVGYLYIYNTNLIFSQGKLQLLFNH